MKAHLIIAQGSVGEHGLFLVSGLFGNAFLSMEKGKFFHSGVFLQVYMAKM
jgi:hypothetical protein